MQRRSLRYGNRMKLSLDRPVTAHLVRGYGPEGILIGERWYRSSVVVTPERLIEDWAPRTVESLTAADVRILVDLRPQVLLLGCGARQRFPSREVLAALHEARIGLEVMDTGAACRTYNLLLAEGRKVAAALILDNA
jgi:uncharacterized protein